MLYISPKLTLCFCVFKCPRQITESASAFQKAGEYPLGFPPATWEEMSDDVCLFVHLFISFPIFLSHGLVREKVLKGGVGF